MMKKKSGLTLIELVLSIIIIGICFMPMSVVYQNLLSKVYQTRVLTTAVSLAEGKMDETLRLGYSSVANVASINFAAPFTAYTYQVIVNYVTAADLNTSVTGPTDYKSVEVRVFHTAAGTVKIRSVLSNW